MATGRRAGLFNLRKQDAVLRNYTFSARAYGDESSFFDSCRHVFIFFFLDQGSKLISYGTAHALAATCRVLSSTIFICLETGSYADFWAPNVFFPSHTRHCFQLIIRSHVFYGTERDSRLKDSLVILRTEILI